MKQYGLPAAVAASVLAGIERELSSLPQEDPLPTPPRRDGGAHSSPPPKRLRMTVSIDEAIGFLRQVPTLERRVHIAIGLIAAWLWFISGHSLLIDLFRVWGRLQ
jgi:hypothetical protein